MRLLSLILTVSLILPIASYANPNGYKVHHSNMESRRDGNIRATLNYLFGRPSTKEEVDKRSEMEKILDTRQFKTWFDFKNRTSDYFKLDINVKPALVKHVNTSQEALLVKLMMIRQAKYTVDLTYYIFHADTSGYVLLNELKEAIRRGISVRFMIDSLGSLSLKAPTHPELKALVEFARKSAGYMKDRHSRVTNHKARVEVISFRSVNPIQITKGIGRKFFRKIVNYSLKLMGKEDRVETVYINPNRRSHDKILIIDQNFPELATAIVGGRNIANEYYGIPKGDESNFIDLEVIVKNDPAALKALGRDAITTNIADLYEQLYFHSGNRLITAGLLRRFLGFHKQFNKMEQASRDVSRYTVETQKVLGEDVSSPDFGKKYLSEGFMSGKVDMAYTIDNALRSIDQDQLEPEAQSLDSNKFNLNHISFQFEKYMAQEEKHIILVSPYLWLEPTQIQKFKVWLGRDPKRKLTIVTNSILTSDNMLTQILVDALLGPKLLLDRTYVEPRDNKTYQYDPEQIEIYKYGRLDSVALGGNKYYGMLHAKGVYLESLQAAFVTTYNADPRSQYLNSETALLVFNSVHASRVKSQFDTWIKESHKWGSNEYHAIRRHPKLGKIKNKIGENVNTLYEVLIKLRLAWLI